MSRLQKESIVRIFASAVVLCMCGLIAVFLVNDALSLLKLYSASLATALKGLMGLGGLVLVRHLLVKTNPVRVPVVMMHSVADGEPNDLWGHLSCPVKLFERKIMYLKRAGFTTISLEDLYWYVKDGRPVGKKSIVLTFDDGFLDNWVNAYPILKKYGMKGTIFATTDFVDPTDRYRPNLEDLRKGRVGKGDLEIWGYLTWREMQDMEKSGVMDIQSHGKTHTWYSSSSRLVDFHHPADPYPWLDWNEYPEKKHRWLSTYPQNQVPYGTPVYEYSKSLETKRYFPNPSLTVHLTEHVKLSGGQAFFKKPDWREELYRKVEEYERDHDTRGHVESDREYIARLESELIDSKKEIEKNLNKEVRFFCWPGGGMNSDAIDISVSERAYWATTIKGGRNMSGEDPTRIARISDGQMSTGAKSNFWDYMGFVCSIGLFRGNHLFYFPLSVIARVRKLRKFVEWLGSKRSPLDTVPQVPQDTSDRYVNP